jgi:hypothetical protein
MRNVNPPRSFRKFRLHPLIHTLLVFTLAQYFAGCQEMLTKSERVDCNPRGGRFDSNRMWLSIRFRFPSFQN